jgi:predicted dehydrogenase
VALCGSDYDRVRALADRLGVPDVHTDFTELCQRDDIDAVTIATRNALHAEQACTAFRYGKHVFCEKPLATSVAEAGKMAGAAEQSGKVHQVGFTFRYGYALRELRRRVRCGDIGEPYYLRIQYDSWKGLQPDWKIIWKEDASIPGGGILYDLGVHLFDAARYVLGPIETTTGFVHHVPRMPSHPPMLELAPVESVDVTAAWFQHENGARGQWFIGRCTPAFADNGYLEVIGCQGALKASLSRGGVDILKASSPTRPEWRELPLPEQARDGTPHCLKIMMQSFVDACLRGGLRGDIDASFIDGLAAQCAIAAVENAESLHAAALRRSA